MQKEKMTQSEQDHRAMVAARNYVTDKYQHIGHRVHQGNELIWNLHPHAPIPQDITSEEDAAQVWIAFDLLPEQGREWYRKHQQRGWQYKGEAMTNKRYEAAYDAREQAILVEFEKRKRTESKMSDDLIDELGFVEISGSLKMDNGSKFIYTHRHSEFKDLYASPKWGYDASDKRFIHSDKIKAHIQALRSNNQFTDL